jgi:thioredoxin 1
MIETLNNANFETFVFGNTNLVLVDVWAPHCGPCETLGKILEDIDNCNYAGVVITKLNMEDNLDIASRYKVRGLPTLLFFENGECTFRFSGLVSKSKIEEKISELI